MGNSTTFVVRVDSDELEEWKKAAALVASEQRASANVSAMIRRAMAAEIARLKEARTRDRSERKDRR